MNWLRWFLLKALACYIQVVTFLCEIIFGGNTTYLETVMRLESIIQQRLPICRDTNGSGVSESCTTRKSTWLWIRS